MHYQKNMVRKMHDFFQKTRDGENLPSLVKFAACIGVSMSQIEEWIKECPDFECAVYQARADTIDYLVDCGLKKTFDPTFVKYLLSDISILFPLCSSDCAENVDINITVTQ